MELFEIARGPSLSLLRFHVHIAPHTFQRDTRDFFHKDPLKSKLVLRGRTVCDGAWDGDGCVFSNVSERRNLARGLVERLHRNGDAKDVGKLGFGAATVGNDDRIYFVEGTLGEEVHSEVMSNGDLKVVSGSGFDNRYIWVHKPARLRGPQARLPEGAALAGEFNSRFVARLDSEKLMTAVRTVSMEGVRVGFPKAHTNILHGPDLRVLVVFR